MHVFLNIQFIVPLCFFSCAAFSNSCCSDYLPFYDNGYSAVGFFENNLTASANPNYHRHTDTFEYLDYELAEKISQAVLASAAELAVVA